MNLRNRLPYRPGTAVIALALAAMAGTIAGCNSAIDSGAKPASPATTLATAPATIPGVPAELAGPKLIARDIKLTSCQLGDFGVVNVSLTVVNHGQGAAQYSVSGELLDTKGVRQGEFAAITVNQLGAGKTARLTAAGFVDKEDVAAVRCHLTTATRF